MQKPPYPHSEDRQDPDRSVGQDNPFGRSFHRVGSKEPVVGEPQQQSLRAPLAELDQRIADEDLYEKNAGRLWRSGAPGRRNQSSG